MDAGAGAGEASEEDGVVGRLHRRRVAAGVVVDGAVPVCHERLERDSLECIEPRCHFVPEAFVTLGELPEKSLLALLQEGEVLPELAELVAELDADGSSFLEGQAAPGGTVGDGLEGAEGIAEEPDRIRAPWPGRQRLQRQRPARGDRRVHQLEELRKRFHSHRGLRIQGIVPVRLADSPRASTC